MQKRRPVEETMEYFVAEKFIGSYVDSVKMSMFTSRDKGKARELLRGAVRLQGAFKGHRFKEVAEDLLRIAEELNDLIFMIRESPERETHLEYAEFVIMRERKNVQACMRSVRLLVSRSGRPSRRGER